MEGMITFKFEGMTLFKLNVWQLAALLLLDSPPISALMPDKIFIDDTEISKPNYMEDHT